MYPAMKAEIAARDGDLRLCLLLEIAAWFLFLDHIPHNAVSLPTLRNFGFSGATDLFVSVGGCAAAILHGKMMLERGLIVTATRVFRRLWQLDAAYVACCCSRAVLSKRFSPAISDLREDLCSRGSGLLDFALRNPGLRALETPDLFDRISLRPAFPTRFPVLLVALAIFRTLEPKYPIRASAQMFRRASGNV
jgi:hypothetical protein